MSVYVFASRVSSVEYSVNELGRKADSFNAVMSGTTTINGLALLNCPVALGSSITGIDISNVAALQTALDLKAPSASPISSLVQRPAFRKLRLDLVTSITPPTSTSQYQRQRD